MSARSSRTGESWIVSFWRLPGHNRRRYGGYFVHVGIVLMAIGVVGIQTLQTTTQSYLQTNQSVNLDGYTLTYRGLQVKDTPNVTNEACATIDVGRSGQVIDTLRPCQNYYYQEQQMVTVPGLRSMPLDDLYVVMVDWEKVSQEGATFKVFRNPLVIWLWIGALVLLLGGITAILPEKSSE